MKLYYDDCFGIMRAHNSILLIKNAASGIAEYTIIFHAERFEEHSL